MKRTPEMLAALRGETDDIRRLMQEVGRHPTLEECETAGRGPSNYPGKEFESGGLPDTPDERARFEAYMRGHCWQVGKYDESLRCYDTVGVRMLYGVWRDRGALPTVTPGTRIQRRQRHPMR